MRRASVTNHEFVQSNECEGVVRLLEDGYELVKGYLDAAHTEKGAA